MRSSDLREFLKPLPPPVRKTLTAGMLARHLKILKQGKGSR